VTGLRVIGGAARGLRLRSVPGDTTRPITDRVKEALFNIIGADIQDSSFLDLFGGTGAVGIEALSRGANFCLFIDVNHTPVKTIRENLKVTHLENHAEVHQADAITLLNRQPDKSFDYIYIAPPQYKGVWKQALLALDTNPAWMSQDAWVIVQIHPVEYEAVATKQLHNIEEFDQRDYGSTLLVFFQPKVSM
jgi:16S rRNA (guanine966-N2)-methyltransferase